MMNATIPASALKKKDFASDQDIRWCPGCGDYAILSGVQKAMADIGAAPHQVAVVSGIGCSSRFPYYMGTYGFHSIHGRAPAIATGLKLANPDLHVWVITGDGDGLSIGGNHMLHALRRNVDLNIILFNNKIYGLTKGQYSPTTEVGHVTPSSPYGSVDLPVIPARFALGAGAGFVARGYDVAKELPELFVEAHAHQGASFVEILQNCVVFNDGTFDEVNNKKTGSDHRIWVKNGEPMIFGQHSDKGIRVNPTSGQLEAVELGNGITEADLCLHDETNVERAWDLSHMKTLTAFGVLYRVEAVAYDAAVRQQVADIHKKKGNLSMEELLRQGHTWQVD